MVVLDGVYMKHGDPPRFLELPAPSSAAMQQLLDAIVLQVLLPSARRSADP